MRLAIMQPYLFPYIGYFQLIHAADKFVLLDDVNYINKGWINRNRILAGGKDIMFTLPLQEASQNKMIKDISIASDHKWRKKFFRTLEMSYKKAPCFEEVYALITTILEYQGSDLADYIENSIKTICQYLIISTEIVRSSRLYNSENLKGQEKILHICRQERAGMYLNAIGGKELYQSASFEEQGIQLCFIESHEIRYEQFGHTFVPWLSIVDVMMFNSVPAIKQFLDKYSLNT